MLLSFILFSHFLFINFGISIVQLIKPLVPEFFLFFIGIASSFLLFIFLF